MSALNTSETEALMDAQRVLAGVLKEGYNPHDEADKVRGRQIKKAHDAVKTVVTMKGHYPS